MIWRSLICFSLALAPALSAATVSGRIALEDMKDKRTRRDFSGVVVWLSPVNGNGTHTVVPRHVTMVQKDKSFTPHVLAIPVGSVVDFPNYDPIFHNAFSNYNGQLFDVGLYPPGTTKAVTFRREGIVRVFCNIHPTMSAVIAVLNTSWFAVTGRDGSYRINDVPAGEYEIHFFHERATEDTLNQMSRKLRVQAADESVPAIAISEAAYLPTPHKNKYGKDYPPPSDEAQGYRR